MLVLKKCIRPDPTDLKSFIFTDGKRNHKKSKVWVFFVVHMAQPRSSCSRWQVRRSWRFAPAPGLVLFSFNICPELSTRREVTLQSVTGDIKTLRTDWDPKNVNAELQGEKKTTLGAGCWLEDGARILLPQAGPGRNIRPAAWSAAPSRWGMRSPAPRWWTAYGWSLVREPASCCPRKRKSGMSRTAAPISLRPPAPPSCVYSLWKTVNNQPGHRLQPLCSGSTAGPGAGRGPSLSFWPRGSRRGCAGRSCRTPGCPAHRHPRRCTWWRCHACPPRLRTCAGPSCDAWGSGSAAPGLKEQRETSKTALFNRPEVVIDIMLWRIKSSLIFWNGKFIVLWKSKRQFIAIDLQRHCELSDTVK